MVFHMKMKVISYLNKVRLKGWSQEAASPGDRAGFVKKAEFH